jgi:hypothetical protein
LVHKFISWQAYLAATNGLALLTVLTALEAPTIQGKAAIRAYKSTDSLVPYCHCHLAVRALEVDIILALNADRVAI